ncbi:MAG: ABC-three component system middle component 1 [Segatella copri]
MKDAIVKSFDSFDVRSKILVCVTKCLTEDELRETWRNYRNDFAVEFQTDDIDEFERWNFYLFYVVDNKNAIDRSLKYEIEHDTISSRKIVVSKDELQDENGESLVMRYIKYDIGQVKACTEPPLFMCDKNVEKLIK